MRMLHVLLLSAACSTTPAEEVRAALADVVLLPEAERATTRYLTLYNVPLNDRAETTAVVSYLLNAVSRVATIVRPLEVDDDLRLLRFDLCAYGLTAEQWEALVKDGEPYFHGSIQAAAPARSHHAPHDAARPVVGINTVGETHADTLRKLTGSRAAVVRADWFVSKVSVPPFYYQLAGVPDKRQEWYRELGIDRDEIVNLKANHGANILKSGVTRQVRRVSRWQGPLGGVWQTYDVSSSGPGRDPFRDPTFDGQGFRYEASELIAAKANGLHWFALYDAAGRRQDAVPDRIAKDDSDPHGDGIIVPPLSCVRCHVESGLRPVQNDQRTLLSRGVRLYANSPDLAEQLAEFYGSDKFDRDLQRDREDYAAAVQRATGLPPAELAAALATVYRDYVYELVTPSAAAREMGIDRDELQVLFRATNDPVLLALAEGLAVQRAQWEAAFALGAVLEVEEKDEGRRMKDE